MKKIGFDNGYGNDVDVISFSSAAYSYPSAIRLGNKIYTAGYSGQYYYIVNTDTNEYQTIDMLVFSNSTQFINANGTIYVLTVTKSNSSYILKIAYADTFSEIKSYTIFGIGSGTLNNVTTSDPFYENGVIYIAFYIRYTYSSTSRDDSLIMKFDISSATFTKINAAFSGPGYNHMKLVGNAFVTVKTSGTAALFDIRTGNVISPKVDDGENLQQILSSMNGEASIVIDGDPAVNNISLSLQALGATADSRTLYKINISLLRVYYDVTSKKLTRSYYNYIGEWVINASSSSSSSNVTSIFPIVLNNKLYCGLNTLYFSSITYSSNPIWVPCYKLFSSIESDSIYPTYLNVEARELLTRIKYQISALNSARYTTFKPIGNYLMTTGNLYRLNTFRLPYVKDGYIKVK